MTPLDLTDYKAYAELTKTDPAGAAITFGWLDGFRLSELTDRLTNNPVITHLVITDDRITYECNGNRITKPLKRCGCGELFAFDWDRHGPINNPRTLNQRLIKGARQCNNCQKEKARKASRESSWLHRRRSGQVKAGVAKCQNCGKLFDQVRSTARFCSTKCRVAAHRAKA